MFGSGVMFVKLQCCFAIVVVMVMVVMVVVVVVVTVVVVVVVLHKDPSATRCIPYPSSLVPGPWHWLLHFSSTSLLPLTNASFASPLWHLGPLDLVTAPGGHGIIQRGGASECQEGRQASQVIKDAQHPRPLSLSLTSSS